MVLDENNEPVIGGNLVIEGTSNGTVTEFDGTYIIENVSPGNVSVTVSYVGYESLTKSVSVPESGTATLDFKIGVDTETLEEVVVVGYTTQRRRELVGNVTKIQNSELNDNVGTTFETALQGKAPGLQIVQGSGTAGSHSIVRIRGTASISSGGDPLYVIDGIPIVQEENYLFGERGGQNNNPLSSLNPSDIESVEILKDASAAAIYGSKGANGVIIITTKRGRTGKPTFNYTTKMGITRPTNILKPVSKDEWLQIRQEAHENSGGVGRVPLPLGLSYDDIANIETDWVDAVIRTGFDQEHNLSVRAGNKWLAAYLGVTYSKNESYLIGNDFERRSARANLDFTPMDKLKITVSSSIARGLRNKTPQAWSGGLGLAQSNALPFYPITRNEFPEESPFYEPFGYFNQYQNPVAQIAYTDLETREIRYLNNIQISYVPTDRLVFTLQGNYDFTDIGDYSFEQQEWTTTVPISKAWLFKSKNRSAFLTGQYDVPMAENHSVKVLAGTEYQQYDRESLYAEYSDKFGQIYSNSTYRDRVSELDYFYNGGYKFFSLFGRVNYSYKDKFYAQVVFRRDASSKFGAENRWGNFPSVGLGYIVSEEDFWPENFPVNYLKLKGSWGLTGNSNIPDDAIFATFAFNNNPDNIDYGNYYNGNTQHQIKEENPFIKWETVSTIDVGIEVGMFDDRITSDLTFYNKLTQDAILGEFVSASAGYDNSVFFRNIGKIRNRGVEFEITSRNFVGKFSWTTDLNIGVNRNKVLDVGNATPDALDGGFGDTRVIEGQPIGVNYIVEFSHVDPATGAPVYLDADGNETFEYNPTDNRVVAGSIQPDFTGGLKNTFRYKNIGLDFLFYFVKGGTIYDDAAKRQLGVIADDWTYMPYIFDRWREPGDLATFPKYVESMNEWGGSGNIWQNNHTLWLYDASFIRLRNITLSYSIKPKEGMVFKNVRLYVQGINLLTFTKYPGWDPEIARDRSGEQARNIGGTNVTYLTPPQAKSFIFGASFDF